mmetsp:Transcript_92107/g.214080  ORF Transcript_92107/g.214080 Transcript_92107/m.214080 type:complete len:413 (+) Transcript_92107:368-1606(+)
MKVSLEMTPSLLQLSNSDFTSASESSSAWSAGLSLAAMSKNETNSASSMAPLLSASKSAKSSSCEICLESRTWAMILNATGRTSFTLSAALFWACDLKAANRFDALVMRLSMLFSRSSARFTRGTITSVSFFTISSSRPSSMGRSSFRASTNASLAPSTAVAASSAMLSPSERDILTALAKGSTHFSASLMATSTWLMMDVFAAAALAFSTTCGSSSLKSSSKRSLLANLRYSLKSWVARESRLSIWPRRNSGRLASAWSQLFSSALISSSDSSLSGSSKWPCASLTASWAKEMLVSAAFARASISSTDLSLLTFAKGSTSFSAFSTASSAASTGCDASLSLSFSSILALSKRSFFSFSNAVFTDSFAAATANRASFCTVVTFCTSLSYSALSSAGRVGALNVARFPFTNSA